LSSLSGDRIWRAWEASNGFGNGIDNDLDVRKCSEGMGKEYTLCGRVSVDDVIVRKGSENLDADHAMALSNLWLALFILIPQLLTRDGNVPQLYSISTMKSTGYLGTRYFR